MVYHCHKTFRQFKGGNVLFFLMPNIFFRWYQSSDSKFLWYSDCSFRSTLCLIFSNNDSSFPMFDVKLVSLLVLAEFNLLFGFYQISCILLQVILLLAKLHFRQSGLLVLFLKYFWENIQGRLPYLTYSPEVLLLISGKCIFSWLFTNVTSAYSTTCTKASIISMKSRNLF